uniref:Dof-type domain-containing protein n=1 Tax=Oryza rufipogon TaxID=4529 RepID=A0A0E0QYB1_ORYRU
MASTSAAVSGSVPVGLAAKNPKLMHEGAQDLNLAFPHHHGHALQSPEFTAFPSLKSSTMCNPGGNLAAANGAGAAWARVLGDGVAEEHRLLRSSASDGAARDAGGICSCGVPSWRVPHAATATVASATSSDCARFLPGHAWRVQAAAPGCLARAALGCKRARWGRLLFPFEDLKLVASATASDANSSGDHQYDHGKNQGGGGGVIGGHETPGFWNSSMLGNGSSNGGGDSW